MVTRACLRYAREGQNVTQAGPKCHTSRAKMSHKGQNVTQSCYNYCYVVCFLGLRICSEIDESQPAAKTTNLAPCAYQDFLKWDISLYKKDPLWHSHACWCHFFNWTSPWKNMKHWLIICRMNHWPLESGSSELVKTHMVMVEIRLVVLTR